MRENGVGRRLQQEDVDGENWIPRGRIAGRHERIGRRVRQRLRQEQSYEGLHSHDRATETSDRRGQALRDGIENLNTSGRRSTTKDRVTHAHHLFGDLPDGNSRRCFQVVAHATRCTHHCKELEARDKRRSDAHCRQVKGETRSHLSRHNEFSSISCCRKSDLCCESDGEQQDEAGCDTQCQLAPELEPPVGSHGTRRFCQLLRRRDREAWDWRVLNGVSF